MCIYSDLDKAIQGLSDEAQNRAETNRRLREARESADRRLR